MSGYPPLWCRLAADSTMAFMVKALSLPMAYLAPLALAHLLGAEGLGAYALGVSFITTGSMCCRLGLDTGMLRLAARLQSQGREGDLGALLRQALPLVLGLSGMASMTLYLAREWIAGGFRCGPLKDLFPVLCPALPLLTASSLVGETLRGLGGVRAVVVQQELLGPGMLLIAIGACHWLAVSQTRALGWLAWTFTLTGILGAGLLGYFLRPLFQQVAREDPGISLQTLCRESRPYYVSMLFWLGFNTADSLILGFFRGPRDVACYEVANRAALLVSLPLLAVNAVVPPWFARLHQEGRLKELEDLGRSATQGMFYFSLPAALFLMALAPDLLSLFGPGFEEAGWGFRWLAVAQLVNVICGSVGFLLAMTGYQRKLTRILTASGIISLPLFLAGAAFWGLTGLAAAKAGWLVFLNLALSWAVWQALKVRLLPWGIKGAVWAAGLSLALLWCCRPHLGPWGALGAAAALYLLLMGREILREVYGLRVPSFWEANG